MEDLFDLSAFLDTFNFVDSEGVGSDSEVSGDSSFDSLEAI
jgi:hypothetical protein